MKKKLILRNEKTGEYFTNDYECWWSRDIKDAYQYQDFDDEDLDSLFSRLLNESYKNPLEGVDYVEIVTFYCR